MLSTVLVYSYNLIKRLEILEVTVFYGIPRRCRKYKKEVSCPSRFHILIQLIHYEL